MSSTDKLVIPAYKQGSEREFNEWLRNLRTAAKQHKYLLDIIEVGTIRPGAEREDEAVALHVRYKNVGTAANDGNVNPPAAGAPAPRTTRSLD